MLNIDTDILDAMPVGVLIVNAAGRIVHGNQLCHQLFGYESEELAGQALDVLIPLDVRGSHSAMAESYFGEFKARSMGTGRDFFGQCKNGTTIPVEIGLNPFSIDGERAVLATLVDISVRKSNEDRIRQYSKELVRRDAEKDVLIDKLRVTLEELHTLSGLIPICACCRKVRDDEGYWQAVECFLHEKTDASFTYSYCPECMEETKKDLKVLKAQNQDETPGG